MADARLRLQLSTRDLARRAGISQAYVVALERARNSGGQHGPTPTVDVVAALAHALGLDPVKLFTSGLRSAGRHALVVVDDARLPIIGRLREVSGTAVDMWVAARSPNAFPDADASHAIQLRTRTNRRYEPTKVAASLDRELRRLAPAIEGANVGFVFGEMSDVMTKLDDPSSVIAFEDTWATVTTNAAAHVGARAQWNVCVYEIAAIQALADPVAASLSLMRTHDIVLASRNDHLISGLAGVRQIAVQLRPPTQSAKAWRTTVDHIVGEVRRAS